MTKRVCALLAVVLAVTGLASATSKEFSMGHFYLTPQIGFGSWGGSIPFGVNAEYALTENIGIGGTVMAQFWSETNWKESWITLSAEALYHFIKLAADKFDLYVGAGLGYGIYSVSYSGMYSSGASGSSGLTLEPIVGARYYFSPKVAVSLRILAPFLGGFTGFGATAGVTFDLK
jgi:outer membrane protein W